MEVFIFGEVNAVLQNLKKSRYNNHLFSFISIAIKGKTKIRFLIKKLCGEILCMILLELLYIKRNNFERTDFLNFKNFEYHEYADFVPQRQYHYLQILFFVFFFGSLHLLNLIFPFSVVLSLLVATIHSIFLCE